MVSFYGARFADAWRGVDVAQVKADWSEELSDYTVDEIRRGIGRLRDRPFPPTLPEFLLLCRPKPDPQAAHAEACRLIGRLEGWSDCAVFWAAREIGYFDLKNLPYDKLRGRWIDALDRAWQARRPIPAAAPIAGVIAADAGEKARVLTEEERAEVWRRLREFGNGVAMPARHAPASAQEIEAALREIEARQQAVA